MVGFEASYENKADYYTFTTEGRGQMEGRYDMAVSYYSSKISGMIKPKNIDVTVEGDGFSCQYNKLGENDKYLRSVKITVTENTSTEVRKGRLVITATKGKKSETFYRDLIQLGAVKSE